MNKAILNKNKRKAQRAERTRSSILGTKERPRMSVHRSLSHISVQIIDDTSSKTLVAASDIELKSKGTKTDKAKEVGALIAKKAKEQNISKVVFDRGANRYHGRVKALAEAAREVGLEF